MPHCVTLIEGDGIGPEVAEAAVQVLKATGAHISWERAEAGLAAFKKHGDALPQSTIDSIKRTGVALKGPTTTPVGEGHVSANVRLRKELDLFASVRPVRSLKGVQSRYEDIDLVIFRENTEGLYSGSETAICRDVMLSIKVVTEHASERIARAAFEFARKKGRKRVSVLHKANIMKIGDGFFIKCVERIAKEYPEIKHDKMIIDAACMRLVQDPTQFDVLVMENLYGDIVSDLCAGLVGGLGVVPGANLGHERAIFEAVHGSAPDIAGQGKANPMAILKSSVLLLEHLGELSASQRLDEALNLVFSEAKVRTGDIGGTSTTQEMTDAVIEALGRVAL